MKIGWSNCDDCHFHYHSDTQSYRGDHFFAMHRMNSNRKIPSHHLYAKLCFSFTSVSILLFRMVPLGAKHSHSLNIHCVFFNCWCMNCEAYKVIRYELWLNFVEYVKSVIAQYAFYAKASISLWIATISISISHFFISFWRVWRKLKQINNRKIKSEPLKSKFFVIFFLLLFLSREITMKSKFKWLLWQGYIAVKCPFTR